MKETRYAVLIGMNNYEKDPLDYSVKDVLDIKSVLVNYCNFESDNIYLVTDSSSSVRLQIEEIFRQIQTKFIAGSDMILFYYSGHGDYDKEEEKSLLYFEDGVSLAIGEVALNFIHPLRAKNHYLIIDACHSGKPLYIKSKNKPNRKTESRLFHESKELYFIFAAAENKKAFQDDKLRNSYYTYYFIEAIKNNRLYDDDGYLTMNRIDEYVRKKISENKHVIQVPGNEARVEGYKPFAFLKNVKVEEVNQKKEIVDKNEKHEFDLAASISKENRTVIQKQLSELLQSEFANYQLGDLAENYVISVKPRFDFLNHDLEQNLEKAIINKASRKDLEAVNDLFTEKLIPRNRKKTGLSAIFDMMHGEPEPEYSYDIRYDENNISRAFIEFKAKSYANVSGGLYCMFYQALYGFVFCKTFFRYTWDGLQEKINDIVDVNLISYRLTHENVEEAKKDLQTALEELTMKMNEWNKKRQSEIDQFLKNSK
jgi:hypothetical protein